MALSISQFAQIAGVSASAVRYYEAEKLLPRAERRHGKRIYYSSDLTRLKLIVAARASGFGIREMKDIVEGQKASLSSLKRAVIIAARNKKDAIDQQILELEAQKERLEKAESCLCADLPACKLIG